MAELRDLPSIDRLIKAQPMAAVVTGFGAESVKQVLRTLQAQWRASRQVPDWALDPAACAARVESALAGRGYRAVFNLTGTIIHTNLGRALPSEEVFAAVRDLVTRPMNLEYDLDTGKRGDRDGPVERRLTLLTGAEAATVVNNNAAALLLVLNTLARNRAVPVSRGELIEIGGSFRLPDVMERAGCRLLEVGTTNRTHAADFAAAAEHDPALLLKVHPSNFHVSGFTSSVAVPALAAVATAQGVPLCVDLGSGTLVDLSRWGLPHEPTPQEVLNQGADLVTFSGDKLLGGVQAGLIVGRRDLVEACKRNPLKRALRPDKLTLAFLDQTLALYESPETLAQRLPLLRTLTTPVEELEARAQRLTPLLAARLAGYGVAISESHCQIGSGSLPDQSLPSVAVRIHHPHEKRLPALQSALRALPVPVIGRISQGALWLDMRGAQPLGELETVLATLEPPL
ncbi:MAG: L-seryl-tRNA(Sec) selenium transferase [Pseudomonadales bacterium]